MIAKWGQLQFMDPDFCIGKDDPLEDVFEDEHSDWHDNLFEDNNSFEQDIKDPLQLSADQIGLAMSFGESITEKEYDVDENTDKENWEKVMELYPLPNKYVNEQKIDKFEDYINNITSGYQKGPWV